MLEAKNITKQFKDGEKTINVLKETNMRALDREFVAIVGPSGSGKSTLLTIIGALQSPSGGSVIVNGKDLSALNEKERSYLRLNDFGFVLQGSNLVPYLKINEQFKFKIKAAKKEVSQTEIDELVSALSIDHILNKYPDQISGGERQRAAIALAMILKPKVLLADEPTASLDSKKAYEVAQLLRDLAKDFNTTVIMVTHDTRLLDYCDRILEMEDGKLVEKS